MSKEVPLTIRKAGPADTESIARVHVESWQVAYRGLLPDDLLDNLRPEDTKKYWDERIRMPAGEILIVEEEEVIGFAIFGPSRDADVDNETVGEVFVMYLHPEHWRKGHGRALMHKGMDYLKALGHREVVLWVMRDNLPARRFYEASGFHADGSSQVRKRANGVEMHLVRYRCRL